MSLKFGSYEVLHELKTGGMGAVLLARRRGPGAFEQLVAIKTIRPEFASAPSVRAMFLDEAAILARLTNPGIARVFDFGEEAGSLYMVMEYVAGIAFRDLAEMNPPPQIAARAIVDAARGLHGAHELRDLDNHALGLVHRDISPDNLMLGFDGHVKVIDFGIALVKNRQAPVTEFGTVKGKPPYMSPEQVKNEPIDRRSDVFSLAVVLHEMLGGKPLFDGDSIYAIARAVEHLAIPMPSVARGAELPVGLDAAVMNALDRDVARRTQTAAAFADDLENVLQISGGESLATWADRVLAPMRDDHRAWLARVVAGTTDPVVVGRPTGMVTAIGAAHEPTPVAGTEDEDARGRAGAANDDGRGRAGAANEDDRRAGAALSSGATDASAARRSGADSASAARRSGADSASAARRSGAGAADVALVAAQPIVDGESTRPAGEPTHLAADVSGDYAPKRSRVPFVLGILLLLGLGVIIFAVTRTKPATVDAVDAGALLTDAAVALPAPPDAIVVDAAPPDAAPLLDAFVRVDAGRDAGSSKRDAAAALAPPIDAEVAVPKSIDAAIIEPPPSGFGFVNVYHRANSPYVQVVIDGKIVGPTPQNHIKLTAGTHTVQLLAAKSSDILYETKITVEDTKTQTVRQP